MRQQADGPIRVATRLLFWLLIVGWLTGCASPLAPRETKLPQTYLLEWSAPADDTQASADGPTLLIGPVHAAAGLGSSDMLYLKQPHQLERFAHHRWADAPARMLDPLLVRACEQSGLFRAVSGSGKGLRASLRLNSELLRLQQVFEGAVSRVELELRVTLVDIDSGQLLATRRFALSEPVAEHTPYGGVQAANRAVARLLTQLQGFLAGQLGMPSR